MDPFLGEFVGTLVLMLLGNGVVANVLLSRSKGEGSGWLVISTGWGFAVTIAVYTSGWISGAHLNPAVTIGFIVAGKTPISDLPAYLLGQFLGAMCGSFLVWLTYFSHWAKTQDPTLKLLCFCTKPAIRKPIANLFTEVIATSVLLFGILSLLNPHNALSTGFSPYAIGILIFSIGLSLGGPTGFAINPARDLGPRIMHACLPIVGKGDSDWSYAWIPVVGPLIGGLLGSFLYQLLYRI